VIFGKPSTPKAKYARLVRAMNVLLVLMALGAVAGLVLEYGQFDLTAAQMVWVRVVQAAVLAVFVADRFVRWGLAKRPKAYFRENWLDFSLIAGLVVAVGLTTLLGARGRPAGAIYVLILQVYIVLALALHAVALNVRLASADVPPAWLLVGSFALLALIGSGLLMLPAATPAADNVNYKPFYYIDSVFTAVSATCVTGLVVRDTGAEFTLFGQSVILIMIQLGGLGMMLFGTALAAAVGKGLSMKGSAAVGEMLSVDTVGRVKRSVWFILLTTLAMEAVGAVLFYGMFAAPRGNYVPSSAEAVWHSVFHSVSSFCNAGFALYGRNMMQGVDEDWVTALRDRWQIMGVMAPLIVLGGLGFPVLQDLGRHLLGRCRRFLTRLRPTIGSKYRYSVRSLSLHSKLVLTTSVALLVLGATGLLLLEPRPDDSPAIGRHPVRSDHTAEPDDWPSLPTLRRVREAVFQSVTARTAGFNTINMNELSQAGKLWMCGLMSIGGSPGGTAGGMKTLTFALLLLSAVSALRRREHVEAFKRRIAFGAFHRAVAVGFLYGGLLALTTLLLCVFMRPGFALVDLMFEAASACGTVGLSTGVTASLTLPAKGVIVGAMFCGRLGPLTMLLAMMGRHRPLRYTYPVEDIVSG